MSGVFVYTYAMKALLTVYAFLIGLCFGSFALATAWRLKKKKHFGGKQRSICEHCKHTLAAKDLVPLLSWLWLKGKCRYCHKKISVGLPLAELAGGLAFALSYLFWPDSLSGWLHGARFALWCIGLVLLLILFFYDLQWYKLPNKVIYPLWYISAADFALRFAEKPTLHTIILGCLAILVGAGLFWIFYVVSKGKWIGFGDVRLGFAIGLLLGTPLLAAIAIFTASIIGVAVTLPSLAIKKRTLTSRIPFGPLLILGLILARLFGQKTIDWYTAHLLLM